MPVREISGNKPLGYFISSPEAIKMVKEYMDSKFSYSGKLDIHGIAFIDCILFDLGNRKSKQVRLMIDTGAKDILLNQSIINLLELNPSGEEIIVGVGLNNFEFKGCPYAVSIGIKSDTKDLMNGVMVFGSESMTFCDGVIGTHFFLASKLKLEINYANSTFTINDNG